MTEKLFSFTDLQAWKDARKLVLIIYQLTADFPQSELFALTNQMRRAVISISSNIAEGFSRRSLKDKAQFYFIAKGSLTELQSQVILAYDIGYLTKDRVQTFWKKSDEVSRLLTGLIRYTQL